MMSDSRLQTLGGWKMAAYRAAYWTGKHGAVIVLTRPEHAHLSNDDLLAEARRYAKKARLDLSYGKIVIGKEWAK